MQQNWLQQKAQVIKIDEKVLFSAVLISVSNYLINQTQFPINENIKKKTTTEATKLPFRFHNRHPRTHHSLDGSLHHLHRY